MPTAGLLVRFVIFCATCVPVCVILSRMKSLVDDSFALFSIICVILPAVCFLAYLLIFRPFPKARKDPYAYLFALFGWTAAVDALIAASGEGFIDTLAFYLENGEPYMRTVHCILACWWDCSAHLIVYGIMLAAIAHGMFTIL